MACPSFASCVPISNIFDSGTPPAISEGMKTNLSDRSRSATVLVCSDDAVFGGHLTRLLAKLTCRTVAVQRPAEALSRAEEDPPDLFVCLHEPPVVDSFQLVSALRKKVWVPVLLAARDWSPALVKAAVAAGAAAFLTKHLSFFTSIHPLGFQTHSPRHGVLNWFVNVS